MRSYASLFLGLLAVQQAAANGRGQNWGDCQKLPSCSGACNQCSDQQKQGLDFSSPAVPTGQISNYGGFKMSGMTCGNFGGSKKLAVRGSKLARNGGVEDKCVQGTASKSSGPSISCGSGTKPFSVNNMAVSVDKDTDVHFVYGYANGQQCNHVVSCKAGQQNNIQNTQCGGATSVSCQLPQNSPHENCNVGIHSVGFDCSPCSSPPASVPASSPPASVPSVPVSSPSVPYPSVPLSTGPASVPSVPASGSVPYPSVPLSTGPASSPPASSPNSPQSPPASSSSTTGIPTIASGSSSSPSASSPNSPQTPTVPGSTVPVLTTEVVYTTVTSCPVTTTHTSGTASSVEVYTSVSTVKVTSTRTICTKCVAPPQTPSSSPPASSPNSPQQPSSSPAPSAPASSAPASSPNSPQQPSSSAAAPPPPGTTQEVVTTEVVYTTVTTCPVTATITSAGVTTPVVTQSVSTIVSTSISTVCTKCVAPPASSAPASSPNSPQQPATSAPASSPNSPQQPATSAPAAPTPSAPGVLPSCLKTWLTLTKCVDNADSNCFCQDSSFTNAVQQCVSSWANGQAEEQAALSYLAGICAPHVSQNPGIVANVPSTVTLAPTAAPSASVANSPQQPATTAASAAPAPTSAPAAPAGPLTTISVSTTLTLPCPSANAAVSQITDGQLQAPTSMAPGACTTTSVVNTAVTVPQVYISSGASATGLAAGTPAPAAASATAAPTNVNSPAQGVPVGSAPSAPVPTKSTTPFVGAAGKVESSMLMSVVMAAVGLAVLA